MIVRALAVLAALLCLASVASAVPTQNQMERQLRCVTCGTTLDVSNAPSAQQMKDRIAREIAAGRTEQEILDGFVRDYGRTVLASPPKSGRDLWLAWALPLGVPLLVLATLPFVVRRWRKGSQEPKDADVLSEDDRERVDRAIDEFGDG